MRSVTALRWTWRLVRSAALLWVGLAALLWVLQDRLIFHPPHDPGAEIRVPGEPDARLRALEIPVPGTTLRGWLRLAEGEEAHPTLLYFGGNAERVERRLALAADLVARGWNIATVAYRGYGPSGGSPGVATLVPDALAVYDAIASHPYVDPSRLVAWGSSLGCGPAVAVAAHRTVRGLFLLAPWSSFGDIGADRYPWLPVRTLLHADLPAAELAPRVEAPTVAAHGTRDTVIPHALGVRLVQSLGGDVTFLSLGGEGHGISRHSPRVRIALAELLRGAAEDRRPRGGG